MRKKDVIWHDVCDILQKDIPAEDFNKWLLPLILERNEVAVKSGAKGDASFLVVAENYYKMKWVKDKYGVSIKGALVKLQGSSKINNLNVKYSYLKEQPKKKISQHRGNTPSRIKGAKASPHCSFVNPATSLESFVVGESNKMAKELIISVLKNISDTKGKTLGEKAGIQTNTQTNTQTNIQANIKGEHFIIYGDSGIGKTHLLQGLMNNVTKTSNIKAMYVTADHFLTMMTKSIIAKKMDDFKAAYKSADLLLIDDIHFFAGKEKTQTEFFHVFNHFLDAGKNMVISCDQPPHKINGIHNRLKTRLAMGVMAAIDKPDLATRIAIIKNKGAAFKVVFDDNCATYIAERINRSVRDLEGAVKMVVFYAKTHNMPPNLTLIRQTLKDILPQQDHKASVKQIQKAVADSFGIQISDLTSQGRSRSITAARQMAMCLCRELTSKSTTEIGLSFGGKNHSTVLYSCTNFDKKIKQDNEVRERYNSIKNKLRGGLEISQ